MWLRAEEARVIFKQYALGCLSQLSYLIGDESTGRAVVVDPHRDVSVYRPTAAPTSCPAIWSWPPRGR